MARTATQETSREATLSHVSKALRSYMKRNKLSVREFNEQVLQVAPRNVSVYNWLAERGLPSKQFIPVLAKALGKPHGFFEAREASAKGNGEAAEADAAEASQEALEAFDELTGDTPPATPSLPLKSVLEARNRVITRARDPRVIAREAVRRAPEGPTQNSLTYVSNGDGTATVTAIYRADREAAQRVFVALSELGVDVVKIDETKC